jgi:hypothetical protein
MSCHFFFDVTLDGNSMYDYRGQRLQSEDAAREKANLMALDLSSSSKHNWAGSAVQVRDITGKSLFSVTVPQTDHVVA